LAGSKQHRVDRLGSSIAEEGPQLSADFAAHRFLRKCEPRNRNGDDQQRPERKDRIIGKRCTEPRRLMLGPVRRRVFEKGPHRDGSNATPTSYGWRQRRMSGPSPNPRRNATTSLAASASDLLLRNPIAGIAACCARAARGHAAALPSSVT